MRHTQGATKGDTANTVTLTGQNFNLKELQMRNPSNGQVQKVPFSLQDVNRAVQQLCE